MVWIKRIRTAFAIILLVLCAAIIGEVVYFLLILSNEPILEKADLIVVFSGHEPRIATGFQLAHEGFASYLVISPATKQSIKNISKKYGRPESVAMIIEDQARTTFENALYTNNIIKHRDYKSIILVTSWDHMPRSYLLLKVCLEGTNTQIVKKTVPKGRINGENWYKHLVAWKLLHNEILKCWGSLIEYGQFKIYGELPAGQTGKNGFFSKLKEMFLFDIDLSSLDD